MYEAEIHLKHHKALQPLTMCRFMMIFYIQCNIRVISPSFCSPSVQESGRCAWSIDREIWLDLHEHMIQDCLCPFNSHDSGCHAEPYQATLVCWDPLSVIPKWLRDRCLVVWPNIQVWAIERAVKEWWIPYNFFSDKQLTYILTSTWQGVPTSRHTI